MTPSPFPLPRGPLSSGLLDVVGSRLGGQHPVDLVAAAASAVGRLGSPERALDDEDVQLSLTLLYEVHYQGFGGVLDRWEWDAQLLAARAVLEDAFEAALRAVAHPAPVAPADVPEALFALTAPSGGPGLSSALARSATLEQWREFLVHRSVYHLKEADPHTWAIPRLSGAVKAALVEVQADEYGGGRPARMHAALFARTMRALDLDDAYGAHLDRVPATTLATVNAMSLFGLHRRLLGAIVGHLAAFEMTSSEPNRLYGNGLRRLGFDADATWFFDEHVEADAVHEQIAGRDLAGGLALEQPERVPDILFGAAVAMELDERAGRHLLGSWQRGLSSLRPVTGALAAA